MANNNIKNLGQELTTRQIVSLIDAHLEYLNEKEIRINFDLGDSIIMGQLIRMPKGAKNVAVAK